MPGAALSPRSLRPRADLYEMFRHGYCSALMNELRVHDVQMTTRVAFG